MNSLSNTLILNQYLGNLKDNTTVITQSDKLKFASIKEGVMIVLALWSGASISNGVAVCKYLGLYFYCCILLFMLFVNINGKKHRVNS